MLGTPNFEQHLMDVANYQFELLLVDIEIQLSHHFCYSLRHRLRSFQLRSAGIWANGYV